MQGYQIKKQHEKPKYIMETINMNVLFALFKAPTESLYYLAVFSGIPRLGIRQQQKQLSLFRSGWFTD